MKLLKPITIENDSSSEMISKLEKKGVYITETAREMIKTLKRENKEEISVALIQVKELGFTDYPTTTELFDKIKSHPDYGILPSHAGVYLALQRDKKIFIDWPSVAMNPITAAGNPRVFRLGPYGGELILYGDWARPRDHWDLDGWVSVRFRKETEKLKNLDTSLDSLKFRKIKGKRYVEVESILNLLKGNSDNE